MGRWAWILGQIKSETIKYVFFVAGWIIPASPQITTIIRSNPVITKLHGTDHYAADEVQIRWSALYIFFTLSFCSCFTQYLNWKVSLQQTPKLFKQWCIQSGNVLLTLLKHLILLSFLFSVSNNLSVCPSVQLSELNFLVSLHPPAVFCIYIIINLHVMSLCLWTIQYSISSVLLYNFCNCFKRLK